MTRRTYAVSWREDAGAATPIVGRLELAERHLRVRGRAGAARDERRTVPYADIFDVFTRRVGDARALELVLRDGAQVLLASHEGSATLAELLDELRARAAAAVSA